MYFTNDKKYVYAADSNNEESDMFWLSQNDFPLFKIILLTMNQLFTFRKIFIYFMPILSAFFTFSSWERFWYLSRAFFCNLSLFFIISSR